VDKAVTPVAKAVALDCCATSVARKAVICARMPVAPFSWVSSAVSWPLMVLGFAADASRKVLMDYAAREAGTGLQRHSAQLAVFST
jgi:hypothetical protein